MKALLASFARYEKWANEKIAIVILSLNEEQQHREIVSSFPSVFKTCLHMWDASSIWWQRLQHHSQMVVPSKTFQPSMKDVMNGLLQQNQLWIEWMNMATEEQLENMLVYRSMKGDPFEQPVKDILLHLNNHGTYHRGQLVTMLRQLGVTDIPQTDYILYSRD
jgi:uncharacterized damage-inducible protein DinB